MRARLFLISFLVIGCRFFQPQGNEGGFSEPDMVMDRYHGQRIKDPFRWMEDTYSGQVTEWVKEQNEQTETYLSNASAGKRIRDRAVDIAKTSSASYDQPVWRAGRLFALKTQPPKNQPFLVAMPSPDNPEAEVVIFDPNLSDPNGSVAIDWYVPSPDGSLVAVSLSKDGSDTGDLHLYYTTPYPTPTAPPPNPDGTQPPPPPRPAQKNPMEEIIVEVNRATAGGDLEWSSDSSGFYYTRYPRAGERLEIEMPFYQQIYYHRIGTPPSSDQYELGKEFDRTAQIDIDVDPHTDRVLATVRKGDSGLFSHYMRDPGVEGTWRQLTRYEDGVANIVFSPKGGVFILMKGASSNGRILYLSSTKVPVGRAKKVIPTAKFSIVPQFRRFRTLHVTSDHIYVTYQLGGPSTIRAFSLKGKEAESPRIPAMSGVSGSIAPMEGDELLFARSSFTEPKGWYRFDGTAGTASTTRAPISSSCRLDFSDVTVTSLSATSKDGTKVPLHIVHRKDIRKNGANPALLVGDGGFGRSLEPRFNPLHRIWLDHGGVIAYANLRGGGEFGTSWHTAGMLTKKQNVFNDFAACAKLLTAAGFTGSDKLAIMGTGNGGLLVGAMIVQSPKLARAAVARSGIFDMVRFATDPNGEFMVTEYGNIDDPAEFNALFEYSPYHRIPKRTNHPAVLFLSGANDTTMAPFHTLKMAARLQDASKGLRPVIAKLSPNTGYGDNMPFMQKLLEEADVLTFLFKELAIIY